MGGTLPDVHHAIPLPARLAHGLSLQEPRDYVKRIENTFFRSGDEKEAHLWRALLPPSPSSLTRKPHIHECKKEDDMKRLLFSAAAMLCLAAVTGQAQAQTTDTISVIVSYEEVVSVSVSPDTWNLGAISRGMTYGPQSFTATNDGNVTEDLTITGSNGANGWNIGSATGTDTFTVELDADNLLMTTPLSLTSGLASSASYPFDLTYKSPDDDTQGGGVDHSFTITITASQSP
jgi:hypothetical protein